MLAGSPDGCTEALLMAHGFTTALLADLVRDGFVTATREHVGRGRPIAFVPVPDNRILIHSIPSVKLADLGVGAAPSN